MVPVKISVIIPVYNEEDNIPILAGELETTLDDMGEPYEIIFVDDGSTDESLSQMQLVRRENDRVNIISLEENAGQTAAMDAGFRTACGDVVITMDADLQNSPRDIPLLLARIPEYDMVCGRRTARNDPWIKKISSKIANSVRSAFTGDGIRDIGCSLKAYRRECLDGIKLFHGMHRFLPILFQMEGYRVIEVPVGHHPRRYGNSKYNIRNRLFRVLVDLLVVLWMQRRRLNYRIRSRISKKESSGP